MKRLLIKGARVIDPASTTDCVMDIVVMGGRIASMRPSSSEAIPAEEGWDVVEGEGLIAVPGLIDIHTHLREPGYEYKEDVTSGRRAAAGGGFTTILCMANTKPVNDCAAVTRMIIDRAAERPGTRVLPIGALTRGLKGEQLSDMGELASAGCVAFSDDGMSVRDGEVMRRALEYAGALGRTVISHCEDVELAAGGVMNEGEVSTLLGLKGIPNASEDAAVARDIILAELTGARLHVAHVSTRGAVELIRSAKGRGAPVTAEATPHHLTLDHTAVKGYDTAARMSPPLRAPEDVAALRAGLADGTIDAIATDHAPHSSLEKDVEFDAAANGMIGLETSLALVLGLARDGAITLMRAIELMTCGPAACVGIDGGALRVGASADITLIDPQMEWVVDPARLLSKSRNTPFKGRLLQGRAVRTIVGGETIFELRADAERG